MTDEVIELDDLAFKALGLGDAQLTQFSWVNSGRDLELKFTLVGGADVALICTWAHQLQISLRYPPNHGGYPMLWDASLAEAIGERWQVALDFASKGEIIFLCNSVVHA